MRRLGSMLALFLGTSLSAGDLDLYVDFGMLTPGRNLVDEQVDDLGQRTGQLFQPAEDLQMVGLGAAYTFMSAGDFRFRGNLGLAVSSRNPQVELRYLQYQGTAGSYLQASGALKATSLNPGLTAVYVSSRAGEFGIGFEERFLSLVYAIDQIVLAFPGAASQTPGQRLRKQLADPFLSLHATFVQQFAAYAMFTRLAFGVDLKRSPPVASFQAADFQSLDNDLLEALRPRQEVKLALGVRF